MDARSSSSLFVTLVDPILIMSASFRNAIGPAVAVVKED
jgi:hypothetical protein